MKRQLIAMFAAGFVGLQGVSETFTVEYGQWSHQPWEAKCIHLPNDSENPPSDDWIQPDFDDSSWDNIQGPVQTANDRHFIVTPWGDYYSTYWLRRTFDASGYKANHVYKLYIQHDDNAEVYLNGVKIYEKTYYSSYSEEDVTDLVKDLLVDGKNILAVKTSDTGGGDAYIDFGLYEYTAAQPQNPQFEAYYNYWNGGYYSTHDGYAQRCVELGYGSDYNLNQTLTGMREGLYVLKAQAFERNGDAEQAWRNYDTDSITSTLYINDKRISVKNVFDEAQIDNMYQSDNFYQTGDATYIPTNGWSYCQALNAGLYENSLYAYIADSDITIGIDVKAMNRRSVVVDNFRLAYIDEAELNGLISKAELITLAPIYAPVKEQLKGVITAVKAASGYKAKSEVIAANSKLLNAAELSYANYKKLIDEVKSLKDAITAAGDNISPRTLQEANAAIDAANASIAACNVDDREINRRIVELKTILTRTEYKYFEITVNVPGTMGDSILAQTEYFSDVVSLKVSGNLNADDWRRLHDLASLRELDITGVNTISIANDQFRDCILERIYLPAKVETIGESAFNNCGSLCEVKFGQNLKSIGAYAFHRTALREVILKEGFETLSRQSFSSIPTLITVKLPSTLAVVAGACFIDCNHLVNVELSEGLVEIEGDAFYNCNLRSMKFPSTLRWIRSNAFGYNRELSSITFNEGLYGIGDNAFYECDGLTEVTLPSTLVRADQSPFDYCDNLRKVTCLSIEPPRMTDQIPYGCDMTGRELYVPQLSITTYKQADGWSRFPTILPLDILPENITILGEVRLTLPENMPADYHPSLSLIYDNISSYNTQYGRLSVNGAGTLSISTFSTVWDQYEGMRNTEGIAHNTMLVNSHLRADSVKVTLFPVDRKWNFISFPFDVKVSEIEDVYEGQSRVIRGYSGEKRAAGETGSTWEKMTADSVLHAGRGYIINTSRGNYESYSRLLVRAVNNSNKNRIFTTEDVTIPLGSYPSEFTHNRGWNLIGNPYPSYYDSRFIESSAPITVWDINRDNYRAYSPVDDQYILSPGEAFFVQCPANASGLTFGRDGRQLTKDVRTIDAPRHVIAADGRRTVINLSLTSGDKSDYTRIVINEQASMAYESQFDAAKFFPTGNAAPLLYTVGGASRYAINERPLADGVVELTMSFPADGSYTIALDGEVAGYEVELIDRLSGIETSLSQNGTLTIDVQAGETAGRFALRITDLNPSAIDSIESDSPEADDAIYTITGVRVSEPLAPGFYIKNGKKIYVK